MQSSTLRLNLFDHSIISCRSLKHFNCWSFRVRALTNNNTQNEMQTKTVNIDLNVSQEQFILFYIKWKFIWPITLKNIEWLFHKDAGFVHESFQNETNRIFWDFWSYKTNLWKTGLQNESTIQIFQKHVYETNPRNESLRFGFANPDSRIRSLRIRKESVRKNRRIFKNWLDSWLTNRNESI